MAKPVEGIYEPGKRTMFKIKHERTADCVVAGYRRDVAALRDAGDVVTRYVNKHLAHLKRDADVTAPTLVDLDNAIDLLGTTLQRYLRLATGQNLASVTLLMFDWTSVFNQPWRPK